jgi:hypothetical protein
MSDRRQKRPVAMPAFRISGLLITLVVIGLSVYTLHNRSLTSVSSQDSPQNSAAPAKPAPSPPQKEKPPQPLAEKDPQEFKHFLHEAALIQDKSYSVRPAENRAYWRTIGWVERQSIDDLKKQTFPEVSFNDLVQYPQKFRGQLIRIGLSIRKVSSREVVDLQGQPRKLYELWGWPTDSSGWFYDVVTPDLPPGIPVGDGIEATVTAYGYFFKLQGYQPANAKPNVRPLVAPMLIGRVSPVTTVAPPAPENWAALIVLFIGTVIVAAAIIGWFVAAKRTPGMRTRSSLDLPEPMDWKEADDE